MENSGIGNENSKIKVIIQDKEKSLDESENEFLKASIEEIPQEKINEEKEHVSLTKEQQSLITKELLRKTPEYQVCWELELWKTQEINKFKEWIKQQKKRKLAALTKELKIIEKKKKMSFLDREKELSDLEDQLQLSVNDIEEKENELKEVEKELRRRKLELESDFKRKVKEFEHNEVLLKEQCAHKVNLISSTLNNKENEIESLKEKIKKLEMKNEEMQDNYNELHQKYINSNQINLTQENYELKKKYEDALASKKNYKLLYKKSQIQIKNTKKKYEMRIKKMIEKIVEQNKQQKKMYYPQPNSQRTINSGSNSGYPISSIQGDVPKVNSAIDEEDSELDQLKDQLKVIKNNLTTIQEENEQQKEKESNEEKERKKKNIRKKIRKEEDYSDHENSFDGDTANKSTEDLINSHENHDNILIGSPQINRRKKRGRRNLSHLDEINEMNPNQTNNHQNPSIEEEVRNLIRQKATLLQTGNYTNDDPLIKSIEKKLQQLQNV